MSLFPMFVKLRERLVVVIGGGEIAVGKIDGLLRAGAKVRIVAPEVNAAFIEPIRSGKVGSVVQRGDLQIAISTNGKSPALAQRLRQELEQQFGSEYEVWLEWLGAARELLRAAEGGTESNKQMLHHLASKPMYERFMKEAR